MLSIGSKELIRKNSKGYVEAEMPKQTVTFRLDEKTIADLDAYQKEHGIENRTKALKKILKEHHKPETESEKLTLENQRAQFNATLEKSFEDQKLEPCLYRDLTGQKPRCRNRKPPENLKTDDLRPDICFACQDLRNGVKREWVEYAKIQRASNRIGRKKISLVVGLHTHAEQVEAERDDYKRRYDVDLNNEIKNLRYQWRSKINRKDARVKQLEKYSSDRDQDLKLANRKIEVLKLSQNDSETTAELETMRKEHSLTVKTLAEVSRELKTEKNQGLKVMCPEKGLVTLSFCQKECDNFTVCRRYKKIKEAIAEAKEFYPQRRQ